MWQVLQSIVDNSSPGSICCASDPRFKDLNQNATNSLLAVISSHIFAHFFACSPAERTEVCALGNSCGNVAAAL